MQHPAGKAPAFMRAGRQGLHALFDIHHRGIFLSVFPNVCGNSFETNAIGTHTQVSVFRNHGPRELPDAALGRLVAGRRPSGSNDYGRDRAYGDNATAAVGGLFQFRPCAVPGVHVEFLYHIRTGWQGHVLLCLTRQIGDIVTKPFHISVGYRTDSR